MVVKLPKRRSHIGVGLYSVSEAARLLGVSQAKVTRWTSEREGLVPRFFDSSENILTFIELMELQFIAMFRDEGVSMQTVKRASQAAAKKFHSEYPFSVKRFDTDGRTVFATLIDEQSNSVAVEDLKHGQYVFEQIVRPFFRKLEYRGQIEIARYWPMEKKGRVVLDPKRKFGRPIDSESGVATRTIYDAVVAAEQDAATVAEWLRIPLAAVESAVAFEKSIAP